MKREFSENFNHLNFSFSSLSPSAADVAIGNKEPGDDGGQGSEDTGGDTPEEELGSTVALIENIPDDLSQEFLAMLVECISKDSPDSPSDSSKFTLEIFPDLSSAAVSFQNAKGSCIESP